MEKMKRSVSNPDHFHLLRHLKDVEDLRNSRDCGIESGQEDRAEEIAQRILSDANEKNAKIVILFTSKKRRATESTNLIAECLRKDKPGIRVIISPNPNLIDLDQGEYILPDDYKVGDNYEPLKVAWDAFVTETFDHGNPDYQFGDPIINSDGVAVYPALKGYFTRYGESRSDISLRIYKAIVEGYKIKERIFSSTILNIVLTHSLPYALIKNLAEVARKMKEENFTLAEGTLYKVCWDIYKEDKSGQYESQYGDFSEIKIDQMEDVKFITMLQDEIKYLENKHGETLDPKNKYGHSA